MRRRRGFKPMSEVPGQQSDARWDELLPLLPKPTVGKPVKLRFVGGVATVITHYVKFKPRGSDDILGFYSLCPNWDIEQAAPIDGECPICADFHKFIDVDEDYKWLRMPQSYRYLSHAFHLTNATNGSGDYWGLLNMNILDWKELKGISEATGQPVDDDKNGVILSWVAQKSSNPYMNGVEFKFVSTGKRFPIKYVEKADIYACKINGKIYKGAPVDLIDSIEPVDASTLKDKLYSLGCYDALAAATGAPVMSSSSAKRSTKTNDFDIADEDFDDDSKKVKTSSKRGSKKSSNKGDKSKKQSKDDDLDLDDELDFSDDLNNTDDDDDFSDDDFSDDDMDFA